MERGMAWEEERESLEVGWWLYEGCHKTLAVTSWIHLINSFLYKEKLIVWKKEKKWVVLIILSGEWRLHGWSQFIII